MGFNEHQRGDSEGYRGIPTRPAQSLDEAMGRGAGQARREQELQHGLQGSEGYEAIPPRYGIYLVVLIGVFAMARWMFGGNTYASLLLAGSVGALMLTLALRGLLRGFTPLAVGLAGGAAFGSMSLVINQSPLTWGNIAIHLIIGSAIGIGIMVVRRHRR
ncbi:MAG: hypothetical protein K5880_08635 [Hydrogenophaga sp.]|uniref:hypothetical protein n=1 Tax=Hydrogenophaga sp. TaxID=1904254 RepID=UPI0026049517|nr:hypothetical protein [Hydrogenophaga sp.]MCV0438686.1 hypothetical protein [Hydrogenophaga sp.]